jgi:hypothetical protein
LTNVLETLVNDNEILRGDNAELQHLLTESREDLHGVQERLEEQRANIAFPPYRASADYLFSHTLNKYRTILQWEHHTHHVQITVDFLQRTIQSRSHGEEYSPNNLILA